MAAAALGRMSGAAREKLLPGPGARGLGALARSLVLALLLAPVLCSGNGRGGRGGGGGGEGQGRARRGPSAGDSRRFPAAKFPRPELGPGVGSAPSAVSPGLRSGVVRSRDPSGWAGTVSKSGLLGGRGGGGVPRVLGIGE